MAGMKDLRALLIDCRIMLRKQARDFEKSELCERLDLAIQALTNAQAEPAAAPEARTPPPPRRKRPRPSARSRWPGRPPRATSSSPIPPSTPAWASA